jgi:hypothetical protein
VSQRVIVNDPNLFTFLFYESPIQLKPHKALRAGKYLHCLQQNAKDPAKMFELTLTHTIFTNQSLTHENQMTTYQPTKAISHPFGINHIITDISKTGYVVNFDWDNNCLESSAKTKLVLLGIPFCSLATQPNRDQLCPSFYKRKPMGTGKKIRSRKQLMKAKKSPKTGRRK